MGFGRFGCGFQLQRLLYVAIRWIWAFDDEDGSGVHKVRCWLQGFKRRVLIWMDSFQRQMGCRGLGFAEDLGLFGFSSEVLDGDGDGDEVGFWVRQLGFDIEINEQYGLRWRFRHGGLGFWWG